MNPFEKSSYSDYQTLYKNLYIKIITLIGLPACFIFLIYDIYYSQYFAGIIVILMTLIISFLYYNSSGDHNFKKKIAQEI